MASSDMATVDPWNFVKPSFMDPWFSEAMSRDTQTLTIALTKSLSNSVANYDDSLFSAADSLSYDHIPPLLGTSVANPDLAPPTPAISNVSGGSDLEPVSNKRQMIRSCGNPISASSSRKVTKRKPRPSKRSHTTFFTADPANFRQMVQQVTGARFAGRYSPDLHAAGNTILKPEPQRAVGGRFSGGIIPSRGLPTLDTSAILLDNRQLGVGAQATLPPVSTRTAAAALSYISAGDGGCPAGMDFVSSTSFPTLESWNTI
ncbi:hypothetical protein SAY87_018656 [Trapa incisa]|uniref:VQ domain-containing protein n=1 Tax=Trapa incisa TaxID=236973 RepID=A0AAN7Q5W3_9MYRT|nr:hypothetical protein SAY87_018656 [Trapa incisa]